MLPTAPPSPPPARAPHRIAWALGAYLALVAAAAATGLGWLDALAAFLLATLLLAPALRRRSAVAWALWLAGTGALAALAGRGDGRYAIDLLPVFVNAALCHLFARSLRRGREPLIARLIEVLEGPERLALPRVAAYARGLTRAWALLDGAQAAVLLAVVACRWPDGLLAHLGLPVPLRLEGGGWPAYLHAGSYALAAAFFVGEYAFRRFTMRHLPHAPLPEFLARMAHCWPALLGRLADERASA